MLWLPKYLHDQGEQLEDARPSRRAFLFMAAATVVAAVAPTPPDPLEGWKEMLGKHDDFTEAWMRGGDAMRVLFAGGRRGGKTAAMHALLRAEMRDAAVDPAGVHGMVNHHGLIVPKFTPHEREADAWARAWRGEFPEIKHYQSRWIGVSGQREPLGVFVEVPPDKTAPYAAQWRDPRNYRDKL